MEYNRVKFRENIFKDIDALAAEASFPAKELEKEPELPAGEAVLEISQPTPAEASPTAQSDTKVVDRNVSLENQISNPEPAPDQPKPDVYETIASMTKELVVKQKNEAAAAVTTEIQPIIDLTADQSKNLENLRKQYVAAKKRYGDATGIKKYIPLVHKESKEKVEKELEAARTEYETARAEYVASHVDKFIEEKTKLVAEQLSQVSKGKFAKALDKYKALGDHNLLNSLEKRGKKIDNNVARFGLRMVNARTLISGGLLVGGFFLLPGSVVGVSALAARKGLSFIGSSSGTYDLVNLSRSGLNRGGIEKALKDAEVHSDKLEEFMASLESRAILDGKSPASLMQDKLYQQLLERYKQVMEGQVKTETRPEAFLDRKLSSVDNQLTYKLKSEKNTRLGVAAVSTVVGGLISSGYLQGKLLHHGEAQHTGSAKLVAHKDVIAHTEVQQPTTEHPAAQVPAGAVVHPETAAGPVQLEIGNRGVEGTLLDAIKSHKNDKVLTWLQDHYTTKTSGGDNSPAALVHRFMLEQEKLHSNVKWDLIGKGSTLQITPNGDIILDTKDINFIQPPAVHEAAATGQSMEFGQAAAPVFTHDDIPVPHPGSPAFNFQHLSEEYIGRHGLPAYEQAMNETTRTTVFTTDDAKDLYVVQHARDQAVAALGKTETVRFEHQVEEYAKHTASSGGASAALPNEGTSSTAETAATQPPGLKPLELPKVDHPLTPAEVAEHITPTTSVTEALKEIWPAETFKEIMDKINLSADVLNGNVSHMTIAEFMTNAKEDSFATKFFGLGKLLRDQLPENSPISDDFFEKTSIRDFLIKWLPKNYHAN